MKTLWRTPFVLALFALSGLAQAEQDTSLEGEVEHYLENNSGSVGEPDTFRVFWKSGLRMESGDGNFKIKFGGRIMYDMTWADSDDEFDADFNGGENYVGFRRARLYFSGTVYKKTLFKLQLDFASGVVVLKDVHVGLKKAGPGDLLFGHMKEPFGLNELTSSKYITFMERAASAQAFSPSRNTGMGWFANFGETKRGYLAVGTFFNSNGLGRVSGEGGWGFTLRVGGLAIENKDRDMVLWIGIDFRWSNYRMSDRGPQEVRYRARPQSFGDRFISTGDIGAKSDMRYAFEIAFKFKSVHLQAEFFLANPDLVAGDDPSFFGYYAQIGWFITGESRSFNNSQGAWGRTKPKANFRTGDGGRGAWELSVRWDSTDLTDKGIEGGEMDTLTVGLNWYWNSNTRVMFDYVYADVTGSNATNVGSGTMNIFMIRWQIDF